MAENNNQKMFIRSGQGRTRNLFPGVDITTNAGAKIMLSVVRFEPDSVVPVHAHPHEQGGMLIQGRLKFTIGETTEIFEPGDQWIIPGGVPHTVTAIDGPALALDVFYPIREDYL
ncbi:MAG: cupin domain-containing protein [bacterium]